MTDFLQEWASRFAVGRWVRYVPIAGEPGFRVAKIRSEPWRLGHGQVIAKITGQAGGVAIEHLSLACDPDNTPLAWITILQHGPEELTAQHRARIAATIGGLLNEIAELRGDDKAERGET